MKIKIAAMLTAMLLLTGCAGIVIKDMIQSKAKGIAFAISAKLLKDNPSYRPAFIIASADMKFVSEQEVLDVTVVMAVISRLPKLQSGDIAIYINGALIIFSDELNALAVKNPEEVRLAATGFYQGIDLALGFIVPKSKSAPVLTPRERQLGKQRTAIPALPQRGADQ